jgi:hypothetical protein
VKSKSCFSANFLITTLSSSVFHIITDSCEEFGIEAKIFLYSSLKTFSESEFSFKNFLISHISTKKSFFSSPVADGIFFAKKFCLALFSSKSIEI